SIQTPILIHTQHSFVHLGKRERYKLYERLFTFFADGVVTVSEPIEDTYLKLGVPRRKLFGVRNGVLYPAFESRTDVSISNARCELASTHASHVHDSSVWDAQHWIVYVARIYPGKGQEHAIQIWNSLPERLRKNAALFFVGPCRSQSELAELQSRASAAHDGNRIMFLGASSVPERWYRAATVCLSCSEFEGHPLVPIEAIGNGSPFLASGILGHRFLAQFAVLFDGGSQSSAVSALTAILERASQCPQYVAAECDKKARCFRDRFSFQRTLAQYEVLYNRFLSFELKGENTEEMRVPLGGSWRVEFPNRWALDTRTRS
ncbi:MAG: glycosyltransferase family 4 protein, partial [Bdellovibrionales bacterium]|nr:glycosyltransferase family 4 protein [Bdellovibrionales bacterium]